MNSEINYPLELLDKALIQQFINPSQQKLLQKLTIIDVLPSTNDYLKELTQHGPHPITACLAEQQTAGRGRLGRQWHSPYGTNIYLSLLWPVPQLHKSLTGLSLVVAIAVVEALIAYGVTEKIGIKWPNDIVWQDKKLAGILIELHEAADKTNYAIIGIGLNLDLKNELVDFSYPAIDLVNIMHDCIHRNKVAGILLNKLLETLVAFQQQGFAYWQSKWDQFDICKNRHVTIITPTKNIVGIARGIDIEGNLILQDQEQILLFRSGEVSMRV